MIIDAIRRWMGSSSGGSGDGGRNGSDGPDDPEMIPCEEALARVYEYMDGELDDVSHEQVALHFEVCGRCYPHLRMEQAFREAVRRATSGKAAPADLRERVLALVEDDDPSE